jgi:hypothetical protein
VRVQITRKFRFNLIVLTLGSIDLKSSTTMRLEQEPTVYAADGACP